MIGDGEFRYLPDDSPSKQGEAVFESSFSHDLLGSSIVIVVRREVPESGLQPRDHEFVRKILKPRLEKIAKEELGPIFSEGNQREMVPIVSRIRTPDDIGVGDLLISDDNKAMLIIVELRTEFQEQSNARVLKRIEQLIDRKGILHQPQQPETHIPPGLDLSLSGSATVGRDMRVAAEQSADATHLATLMLVIFLLLLIYRAPFLVLIPVLTVGISVQFAISLLSMLAQAGYVELFTGIDIYVKVVMYGAGVDYCMFLMARYKEELDGGASYDDAIATAVGSVGSALAASAGTTMAGIGMMVFAQFGKFQQAGVAMSFSLFFVLMASLTFAPSMLRMAGRWAFWPQVRSERIPSTGGWISPTSFLARILQSGLFRNLWVKIGEILKANPGKVWLTALAVMTPFAIVGIMNYNHLSFGLLSELPDDEPSVIGTLAVQDHFPAGATGPVTVLLKNRNVDFNQPEGIAAVGELSNRLMERADELHIADIRSVANPFGVTPTARKAEKNAVEKATEIAIQRLREEGLKGRRLLMRMAGIRVRVPKEVERKSREPYVSDKGQAAGHVTRLDIVFRDDPFSRGMIDRYDRTRATVRQLLPESLTDGTELYYIGSTASIRDLKTVTGQDQILIDVLVIGGVLMVLVLLLRQFAVSAYLIISVFFSYLVTLGITFTVFYLLDPAGFAGLDWKVPIFLFTILIAVGEDYNIYLMTRIQEEQQTHGPVDGIVTALTSTGSIISGCGIIMAGTFSALMVGSLEGMQQLGFALAFGVLLDTFVVRPILVPSYLILIQSERLQKIGRFLGAIQIPATQSETRAEEKADSKTVST
ncbi:MAG: hypothetical protein Tsb009_38300 [Planctomycetaceae bacterium]